MIQIDSIAWKKNGEKLLPVGVGTKFAGRFNCCVTAGLFTVPCMFLLKEDCAQQCRRFCRRIVAVSLIQCSIRII